MQKCSLCIIKSENFTFKIRSKSFCTLIARVVVPGRDKNTPHNGLCGVSRDLLHVFLYSLISSIHLSEVLFQHVKPYGNLVLTIHTKIRYSHYHSSKESNILFKSFSTSRTRLKHSSALTLVSAFV